VAWIDDRIWCHPKLLKVSKPARWTLVAGIAYASGWSTKGRLEPGEQETIGSNPEIRGELVGAGLWDDAGDGAVVIHDWDEHNSKRDERREKDRERKRELRRSAGQSAGRSNGRSTLAAHVEGSEGSEGSEERQETKSRAKGIRKTSSSGQSKIATDRPESLTAQEFVGFLVDEAARFNAPLTKTSKGQAARLIANLVAAGAEEQALRTGITRMIERGRPISALTDIVREVAVAPAAEPEVDYPPLPPVAYDWVEPS
jgi:hypothetical protein